MTLAGRLYDAVVDALPYVVLLVGAFSVSLALYAFASLGSEARGPAFWSFILGAFLLWSGWNVLRNKRVRAALREEDGDA